MKKNKFNSNRKRNRKGIRLVKPASQPSVQQQDNSWEDEMDAPAVKVRVAMDGSKEDFRLLSKAAEYIRRWQEKDPDRRFAFFTTCDTHEPDFNKGGYHFERFFKGDKARDLFKYELYMCSNIIADQDLYATHSFMQDYVEENRERFFKEWKEQL